MGFNLACKYEQILETACIKHWDRQTQVKKRPFQGRYFGTGYIVDFSWAWEGAAVPIVWKSFCFILPWNILDWASFLTQLHNRFDMSRLSSAVFLRRVTWLLILQQLFLLDMVNLTDPALFCLLSYLYCPFWNSYTVFPRLSQCVKF